MRGSRHAKIVATLGPATAAPLKGSVLSILRAQIPSG